METIGSMKKFDATQLINKHEFAEVISDELVGDGLQKGDYVYVVNLQAIPVDETNLYLQLLHVVAHRYEGRSGKVDTSALLIIDPKHLQKPTNKSKTKAMMRRFEAQYDEKRGSNEKNLGNK